MKFTLLLIIFLLTACGKVSYDRSASHNKILGGIISPLAGLISAHRSEKALISSAYAAPCSDSVTASLYSIDSKGNQSDSALLTYDVQSDAKYVFDLSKLDDLDSKVQYLVEVTGCDYFFSRPVTAMNLEQDVNYATTFISFATTANLSKNLKEVFRSELDTYLKQLQGNSFSSVYMTTNADNGLKAEFQQIFGSDISSLNNASPKILYYKIPNILNERVSAGFEVRTVHPNPNYNTVYKWKLDGTNKSSAQVWNYTPGGNDQGSHLISLYVGKDDGSGNVDTNTPYLLRTFLVDVTNNVTPIPPDISTAATLVGSSNIVLELATGFGFTNCDSFEKLAITENMAARPTDPDLFTITCSDPITQQINYTLSSGNGVKELRLWAMDSAGNISTVSKDLSITKNVLSLSHANSGLSIPQSTLASGSSLTITLTVRDNTNAQLISGGHNVEFIFEDGSSTGSISTVTDHGNGTYTATLTGVLAGNATSLKAKIEGQFITSPFPTVSVTPGPFSLATSLLAVSSSTVSSGSTLNTVLTPKDAAGNLFPTGISTVTMNSTSVGGTGSFSAVTPIVDGTYTATFTGQVAGPVTLMAFINGTQVTGTASINVTNGSYSLSNSTVALTNFSIKSGNSTTITLTTKDNAGNILTIGGDTVTFNYSGGSSTVNFATTIDNGDGTYTATLTGVLAGSATNLSAYINGSPVSSSTPALTVTPGNVSVATTSISLSNNSVASGNSIAVTLTLKDAAGNNITTGGKAVLFSLTSGTSTGTFSAVTDNNNGTFSASFTGVVIGTAATVSATIDGVALSNPSLPTITVTAGAPTKLIFGTAPSTTAIADQYLASQPVVLIKDANNNTVTSSSAAVTLEVYSDNTCTTLVSSAILATTNPLNATNGAAAFSNVQVTNVYTSTAVASGTRYIKASSAGLSSVCSGAITVTAGAANKLTITRVSTNALAGVAIASGPKVEVLDAYNNRVFTANNSVTLSAFSNTTCTTAKAGVIGGPATSSATSGLLTYSGISFTKSGTLIFKADSPGLTSGCMSTGGGITINPNTITQLSLTGKDWIEKGVCSKVYSLSTLDAYDNLNTTGSTSINLNKTGSATLYSDATCSTPVTNPVSTAAGVINFYIKDSIEENFSISTNSTYAQVSKTIITAPVSFIKTSENTTCKIINGAVECAGKNDAAQIGAGGSATAQYAWTPALVLTSGTTKISGGYANFAFIKDGELYITGNGSQGVHGTGLTSSPDFSTPTKVTALPGFVKDVAVSANTICAVVDATQNGELWCWGDNGFKTVGNNSSTDVLTPIKIENSGVDSIEAYQNGNTMCSIKSGRVYCWGTTSTVTALFGTVNTYVGSPLEVTFLGSNVSQISLGKYHACAIISGGVKCWGINNNGRLGDGTTTNSTAPVDVVGLSTGVDFISTGEDHTCALKAGDLYCWGLNSDGRLGTNITALSNIHEFTPVLIDSNVTEVSAGKDYTCIVKNGMSYCFGRSSYGGLGKTINEDILTTPVNNELGTISQLSLGFSHACAIKSGAAYCWGKPTSSSYIGDGHYGPRINPTPVTGLTSGVTSIQASKNFSCAIIGSGATSSVKCWGENGSYQLGTGNSNDQSSPTSVVGLPANITKLALGESHACAVINDLDIYCWGQNNSGQVGNGTTTNAMTASQVNMTNVPSSAITSISAGTNFTCITVNGSVYCWGSNSYSTLGTGSTTPAYVTIPGQSLITSGATDVKLNGNMACAIVNGGVKCWGYNSGRVIDTTASVTIRFSTPTLNNYIASTGVTKLSVGYDHACVTISGVNKCWGYNTKGQLGDGNYTTTVATTATTTANAGEIYSGTQMSCAVNSGNLSCWGSNDNLIMGNLSKAPILIGPTLTPGF